MTDGAVRVLVLSDTHGNHKKFRSLPDADIFLHAGDFTRYGSGAEEFAVWFHKLPYRAKFLTLGNHEGKDAVQKYRSDQWQALFGPLLLLDRGARVNVRNRDIVILGLPHATAIQQIPTGVDIVLSHEPPHQILDATYGGSHAGSETIARLIRECDAPVHAFGHVHARGGESETIGAKTHINAATKGVLFELTKDGARALERSLPRA
jgi:Icc-related predicted phosphoesterase